MLTASLGRITAEISRRAPNAMIVLVDYPLLAQPGESGCAALPLTPEQITDASTYLEGVTAAMTSATSSAPRAHLVRASHSSRGHGVCSAQPWLYGYQNPAPYHERPAGKAALARLVSDTVSRYRNPR